MRPASAVYPKWWASFPPALVAAVAITVAYVGDLGSASITVTKSGSFPSASLVQT